MRVQTSATPREHAVEALNVLLRDSYEKDTLLLLSGGSALSIVPNIDLTFISARTTITVLDERYTTNTEHSNFSQLAKLPFLENAIRQGAGTIDPRPRAGETLETCARRYDHMLKHWHLLHPSGITIATMGVGKDGHTSGVLPMPNSDHEFARLFLDDTRLVCGYRVPQSVNPHTERITTTLTYLSRHVDHAIVLIEGDNKRNAVSSVFAVSGILSQTPARILHEVRDVRIVTDQPFDQCGGKPDTSAA